MPPPIPSALVSRNPLQWLRVFGPGAIIASLTIGTGELIFSSRGGVIFGYPILFPFLLICILKWTLAYSAARHMLIAGVHPFERWMDLPGPRGWLTILFFLLAVVCIPIWMSFHASVLGDFLAALTGTKTILGGATIYLWGIGLLLGVFLFALAGGYSALEKTQIGIVACMLFAVIITLVAFGPNWLELLRGMFVPQLLEFPAWLATDANPAAQKIASNSVWAELSLYVGVIGGAGYDYLAYTSYLRDKQWGNAAPVADEAALQSPNSANNSIEELRIDRPELRQWLRAPLIDCTLSFVIVLVFSAVFVASGKLVLGPKHQIPGDGAFLDFQAQFVTSLHSSLYPLYVVGAFLTMIGTLYGTLEVAPTILRETTLAVAPSWLTRGGPRRMRLLAICWCSAAAFLVLAVSFVNQLRAADGNPAGLTNLLKPVNLFTGVFACGVICCLNPWMDRRLPAHYRMPFALFALNVLGGAIFILVGLRGYWVFAGWSAMGILAATLALGVLVAWLHNLWKQPG
jgi:hypothetical protein